MFGRQYLNMNLTKFTQKKKLVYRQFVTNVHRLLQTNFVCCRIYKKSFRLENGRTFIANVFSFIRNSVSFVINLLRFSFGLVWSERVSLFVTKAFLVVTKLFSFRKSISSQHPWENRERRNQWLCARKGLPHMKAYVGPRDFFSLAADHQHVVSMPLFSRFSFLSLIRHLIHVCVWFCRPLQLIIKP